jgi:type II secretory pathway component PulC
MNLAALTNRYSAVLLLVIVLLAGVIAVELYLAATRDSAEPGELIAEENALPAQPESRFVPPDISDFPEVLQRPLFFRDRKLPPEPEPELVTTAPLVPLRLKLEGIAISSDSRVAVLRNTTNQQLLQLAEGMSYDGWLLESVSTDRTVFRRGTEVTELLLDPSGQGGRP